VPIGNDCEYKDFDDCVRKNQGADDPEALCGALQRDTEEKCARRSSALTASVQVPSTSLLALDRRADRYEAALDREMGKVANLMARRVKRAPSPAAASEKDLNVAYPAWMDAVTHELLPALEDIWEQAANDQLDAVRTALPLLAAVSLEATPGPSVPPPYVSGQEAAAAYLATARNRLVGIGDLLWDAARTEMVAGMTAGESIPKLARRVSAAAGVAKPRATVIARTEVISASNAGSIHAMRSVQGVVSTKEWLATGDARTRPSHADAEGQVVPLDGTFTVGGAELDFPGDPNGPAEECANCRCTMLYGLTAPEELVAAAGEARYADGAMLALIPSNADRERLALIDGDGAEPADSLHLTLWFLGDAADWDEAQREAIVQQARQAAETLDPVTAKAFGANHWNAGSDDPSWVLAVGDDPEEGSGEDLATVREAVSPRAEQVPEQHSPWVPHVCIAYTGDDLLTVMEERLGPIQFDALRVAFGNDITDLTLGERQPGNGEITPSEYGDNVYRGQDPEDMVPAIGSTPAEGLAMAEEDPKRAPWHGVLIVEGTETGDGREFAKKSLTWPDMPIHLQWQKETTHGGINDVVVSVGTVEKITRKGNEIRGEGFIDLGSEDGAELHRRMSEAGHPGGVSIVADDPEHADVEYRYPDGCDDLTEKSMEEIDEIPFEDLVKCMEPEVVVFHSGRVRAVTVVDTQAFVEAHIELDEAKVASAVAEPVTLPVILTVGETATEIGQAASAEEVPAILTGWALALAQVQSEEEAVETFVSEADWDGSPSRFTDEQYRRASAVCEGDDPPKQSCHLPHHEPGGAVSRAGVHAAAGGRGVGAVKGVSADGIAKAKTHLRNHYTADLDEEPPDSLTEVDDTEETAAETPEVTDVEIPEALVAAAYTVTIPDVPPVDWYLEPTELPAIGAISVTPEGRFYGLLAPSNVRHRGFAERVTVPLGNVDYSRFMNRPTRVALADGTVEEVPAGVVTMNCGHAKPLSSIDTGKAMEHYADSCSIVATVRVGESPAGVWVAGALMPGIEANDLARLLACQLSGDWRPHETQSGMRELAGALLVPVPGFAKAGPTVRLDHGELVAASAPVEFSATGDFTVPVFDIRPDEPVEAEAEPVVDTSFVEDLPDFTEALTARDPRTRAAAMVAELGLDRQSRRDALIASVKGETADV
jgi:2'-5' RNA ligase